MAGCKPCAKDLPRTESFGRASRGATRHSQGAGGRMGLGYKKRFLEAKARSLAIGFLLFKGV